VAEPHRDAAHAAGWRHFRREVTHCELFATVQALLDATREFFDRYNRTPARVLSTIGAPIPQNG
jgi:hypothetical protein